MLYHAIPLCTAYNTIEYNSIKCNTVQYNKTAKSGHLGDFRNKKMSLKKIGPWNFRGRAQIALFGPPGIQKGPDTRSKCVVTMSPTQTGQSGAVGTKSGPPGPSEDLWGPQKGHSGLKRALLGAPGGPLRGPSI